MVKEAKKRAEILRYLESARRNFKCAQTIHTAINASCYARNYYNLEVAAMSAIHTHGFNRVNAVLAFNLQHAEWDGRYSQANKDWAKEFRLAEQAFRDTYLTTHPILVEGFTNYARKLYDATGAERLLLPGRPESGVAVHGYEIVRSIAFDDQRGFAIGLNPDAVNQFVCWQFTTGNGNRDFYGGYYANGLAGAADNYVARVMVHMSNCGVQEVHNHLAAAEMSAEQNFNMIDGSLNNEKPRLDLTDGQTHEEVQALVPEPLPEEKPSVMGQIREARKEPPAPRKHKEAPDKSDPER
jgi:hypothetical protein